MLDLNTSDINMEKATSVQTLMLQRDMMQKQFLHHVSELAVTLWHACDKRSAESQYSHV